MPGLLGICNFVKSKHVDFLSAAKEMCYENHYVLDQVHEDQHALIGRVHQQIFDVFTYAPYTVDGIYVWVDGEFYIHLTNLETCKLILTSYVAKNLHRVLPSLNGMFSVVIYDSNTGSIHLVSDRFGLRRMHYYYDRRSFAWAGDIKALKHFSEVSFQVSPRHLKCFLQLGHFLGDVTLFEDINVVPPATILSFSFRDCSLTFKRYWKWSDIRSLNITYKEAKKGLREILYPAIIKRTSMDQVLSLSGGLDSRTILAHMEKVLPNYTYGSLDCLDVIIARRVAKVKGNSLVIFELESNNWLNGKLEGIWKNDGMSSCFHMHFSNFHRDIGLIGKRNLNGFLGDVVLGGSYLSPLMLNRRISDNHAISKYGDFYDLSNLNSDYFDFHSVDPFFIYNRGIRFISMGSVESSRFIEHQKPFFDYNLIDYLYGLPDEYRFLSKLYNGYLLDNFKEYFEDIPWQRTGIAISENRFITLFHLVNKGMNRVFGKLGLVGNNENYVNYNEWIRDASFIDGFRRLSKNALYKDILNVNLEYLLDDHLHGRANNTDRIGNLMTIELYLQQLFLHRYKHSHEF